MHITFEWVKDVEPPVKSLSFVFLEQKKNFWHNNNSQDFHIKFLIDAVGDRPKHLPLGKIGDVINEIIECETVYGSWTLMHRYWRCRDILKDKLDQENRDHV